MQLLSEIRNFICQLWIKSSFLIRGRRMKLQILLAIGNFTQWTNPNALMSTKILSDSSIQLSFGPLVVGALVSHFRFTDTINDHRRRRHIYFPWIHEWISFCIVCKWYSSHKMLIFRTEKSRNLFVCWDRWIPLWDRWREYFRQSNELTKCYCPFHQIEWILFRIWNKTVKMAKFIIPFEIPQMIAVADSFKCVANRRKDHFGESIHFDECTFVEEWWWVAVVRQQQKQRTKKIKKK